MREIKFRIWDGEIMGESTYMRLPSQTEYGGTDIKVMQYTGLKDKNGQEIYEGDIVKREFEIGHVIYDEVTLGAKDYEITDSGYFVGIVNYRPSEGFILNSCSKYTEDGEFQLKRSGVKIYANYAEVIGNIYENPELLEEPK